MYLYHDLSNKAAFFPVDLSSLSAESNFYLSQWGFCQILWIIFFITLIFFFFNKFLVNVVVNDDSVKLYMYFGTLTHLRSPRSLI